MCKHRCELRISHQHNNIATASLKTKLNVNKIGDVRRPGPKPSKCPWCDESPCTHCHCGGYDGCSHAVGEMCSRSRYKRRLVCNPCEKHKLKASKNKKKKRHGCVRVPTSRKSKGRADDVSGRPRKRRPRSKSEDLSHFLNLTQKQTKKRRNRLKAKIQPPRPFSPRFGENGSDVVVGGGRHGYDDGWFLDSENSRESFEPIRDTPSTDPGMLFRGKKQRRSGVGGNLPR